MKVACHQPYRIPGLSLLSLSIHHIPKASIQVYQDLIKHQFSFRSESNSNFNSKVAQWNDTKALKSASSYLSLSAFGEEFQIGDDGLLSQSMFLDASLDDNYLERLCPDLDLIGHTSFSWTCTERYCWGGEWTGGRGVYNVVWWGSKHFCHYHVHHSHLVFFLFHIKFPLFLNTSKSLSPDFEFFETRSLSATYFQEPPFRPEIDAHFGGNRSSAWQFIFRG